MSQGKESGLQGQVVPKKAVDELQAERSLQAPVSTRQQEYLVEDFGWQCCDMPHFWRRGPCEVFGFGHVCGVRVLQ